MDYTVSFFRVIHVTLVLQACQMGLNRVLIHRKTILQQCLFTTNVTLAVVKKVCKIIRLDCI
jgi:hypothetical protein